MMRRALRSLGAIVVALGLLAPAGAAFADGSIEVNSSGDTVADDGVCTLREAIIAANTDTASGASVGECAAGAGPDFLGFSVPTITLASSLPPITDDMLLDAIDGLTIDAASTGTILDIASGTVLINGFFTFTGGAGGNGGAIHNAGTLDLAYSTVTGSAATAGAGLYNEGTATVRHTTFSHNQASGDGGGIYNTGTLTIVNSTIAANAAGGNGGGISNTGTLTLTNVTISGNSAGQFGGGIEASGTETVVNTIVAGNTDTHTDADVTGAVDTSTTSVVGIPGGKTLADILDPAGLQAHDGVNDTIALALVAGNPAVDAGTQSVCDGDAVHGDDQRGFPRSATQCDIGAYEAQLPGVQAPPAIFVPATSDAGAVVNFASQVTGSDEAGNALPVVCVPPSGSTFPADTSTRVNCSTTDALGHTGTSGFNVVVGVAPISDTALPAERGSATMVLYLLGLLGLLGLISIAPVLDRRLRH